MAQKVFIFLEFIRERCPCNEMIEILENSGQKEAAKILREHNISEEMKLDCQMTEVKVNPTLDWKSGGSKYYEMIGDPRGKCLIINNLMANVILDTFLFKNVFEQLYFQVECDEKESCQNLTKNQMWTKLETFAKEAEKADLNATVVIIISHGQDENITGIDGEDLIIEKIVDLFSNENCPKLRRKPKLFFFNCCRSNARNLINIFYI
jgi:hypothetical protein